MSVTWRRVSLRSLLILMLLFSIAFAWFSARMRYAQRQQEVIAVLSAEGVARVVEYLERERPEVSFGIQRVPNATPYEFVTGHFMQREMFPDYADENSRRVRCLDQLGSPGVYAGVLESSI